ncbi:MAG: hypothetical protein C0501_18945 [Isosphaera sp.]|nr:hypothetical protein [Isosphaera sp.]
MQRLAGFPPLQTVAALLAWVLVATAACAAPPDSNADPVELAAVIDRAIDAKLTSAKVPASPAADDAEFLRRVYLDLAGTIPPYETVAAFLDDKTAGKRAKLIDELLTSPAYARQMAALWAARLGDNVSNGPQTDLKSAFGKWLEDAFAANRRWDEVVFEILTATPPAGAVGKKSAPTDSFFSHDSKSATVEKVTDKTARYFLGVQLGCAQCHDHPYAPITRADYWGVAAFFARMTGKATEDPKQKEPREKPDGYMAVPATFLGGAVAVLPADGPARPVLAKWVTAPDNPYFARAAVNRTWAHFFGRGLVNPVDDLTTGKATHPELLKELARRFAAGGFDQKALVRAVCNSRAYQRSSRVAPRNAGDTELYSHAAVRGLTPQQLLAARQAIASGPRANAGEFLKGFDPTPGRDPTSSQLAIPETLRLLNAPATADGTATLKKLIAAARPVEANVEALYLCVLSRRPTAGEAKTAAGYVRKKTDAQAAYADLFWALLTSAEFQVNH